MALRQEALEIVSKHPDGLLPLHAEALPAIENRLVTARAEYDEARVAFIQHRLMTQYGVAIFGSARVPEQSEEYQFAQRLGRALVEARDVDIVTGGGPGIMEAGARGAKLAITEAPAGVDYHSKTHGINIKLPWEQKPNPHVDTVSMHSEFPSRLQEFIDVTWAAYCAPGGYGTLYELLHFIQALQVGHIPNYRLFLHPDWKPVINAFEDMSYHNRINNGKQPLISESDLFLLRFSDDVDEITAAVSEGYDFWRETIKSRVRIVEPESSWPIEATFSIRPSEE